MCVFIPCDCEINTASSYVQPLFYFKLSTILDIGQLQQASSTIFKRLSPTRLTSKSTILYYFYPPRPRTQAQPTTPYLIVKSVERGSTLDEDLAHLHIAIPGRLVQGSLQPRPPQQSRLILLFVPCRKIYGH